jgi:hypothetical protein
MVDFERIPFGSDPIQIGGIVARDGGLILTGVLSREDVDAVNRDLDPLINPLPLGNWGGEIAEGVQNDAPATDAVMEGEEIFCGMRTKHRQHLLLHSAILREKVVGHPMMAEYIAQVVPGRVGMHSLFSSVAIEIHPGEIAQDIHRDADYMFDLAGLDRPDGPNYVANTLLAMCDVTEEMGATRVIPGSHKWLDYTDHGNMGQTIPATMNAGDMFLYTGKTLHAGGANVTADTPRRMVSTSWTFPWAVGEEAWPFIVAPEVVKTWPKLVQQYIGFRSKPYRDETPGLMWRIETRPLEEKLGLDD